MKGRPFALLGVNSDGARDALKKKLDDEGITWRNAVDGSPEGPISIRWRVHGWPTIYVIDGDGVITAMGLVEDEIERLVKAVEAKQAKGRD